MGFLHSYLLINYRQLYAATLASSINDHNAVLVAFNLLSSRRMPTKPDWWRADSEPCHHSGSIGSFGDCSEPG